MEEVYKKISAVINIDGKRETYTKVYDFVRGKFINEMKEIEVFKDLFCDLSLAGSYADNLKITAPDEFDLDIRLEFPFHSDVIIEEDNFGNININLEDVISQVEAQRPQKEYMVKFLKSVVDGEGYLLQNKFHSWFESCVTKFCIKNRGQIIYQNEILLFSYCKSGPAHTLDIETKHAKLSIDFVPVIRFPYNASIFDKIPECGYWEAVPKPVFGRQSNKSFRCSFVDAERKLLKGKLQFKNTLRLMKKYRDMRPHMTNLKSYYIKTLFLWCNEEKEESYWRSSNLTIMDEMEEMFKKINAAINIDQERQNYTKMYDFVRTTFIQDLKEIDVFKELFCDIILSGSYADNLKISAPDEFDLDIRLEFPFHSDVIIEEDPLNSGNIHINLKDVIKKTEAQKPPKEYMVKFLKSVVDDEGYLLQNKFHSWFESCVTKFLIKYRENLIFNNEKIFVSYFKQGPAHTLRIRKQDKKFSIDFVPVISFPCHKSICKKCPEDGRWEAVPKPINGRQFNKSFRCSFVEAERKLLKGKYNFKNNLRMIKKFRDTKPHMKNLKSYYIKTLFLWSNEEKEDSFWRSPNLTIMQEMFERLERALELKTLPFYWDPRLNLLSALSDGQIRNMYLEVKRARQILLCHNNIEDILNIFLPKTEEIGEPIEQSEKCFAPVVADVLTGFVKQHPLLMCGALTVFGGVCLWASIRNNSRISLMA